MIDAHPNDVVRLRSGGPKMTVVKALVLPESEDNSAVGAATCTWTKEDGSEGRHTFALSSLDLLTRKGQPNIYPCGCSRPKVNLGRCEHYKPGELP